MSKHNALDYSDLHSPSSQQIENTSGVTLLRGTVVRLTGFGIQFPTVNVANPLVSSNFGIAQSDILPGDVGFVTCIGLMRELDTSAFVVGTPLYSTTAGVLSSVALGPIVASVLKQDAIDGVLYVVAAVDLTSGGAVPWDVNGNGGTNPASNFIGTTDYQGLSVRTNNIEAARFTEQQRFGLGTATPGLHFEQRSHSSTNASGLQTETFYLETNSNLPQTAYSLTLANPEVMRFTFEATARAIDGSGRALFTRTGLAYRESSNVQLQGGTWETDNTIKSNNAYSVSYQLGVSSITFRVKSAVSSETRWTGRVIVQRVV